MTYVQDRNALRSLTHKLPPHASKATFRTFVYVLISHMRNKLHMTTYRKYYGGWRFGGCKIDSTLVAPADYVRVYGALAPMFYAGATIDTLVDQAAWIKQQLNHLRDLANEPELKELAQRVLDKNWEEPARKIA